MSKFEKWRWSQKFMKKYKIQDWLLAILSNVLLDFCQASNERYLCKTRPGENFQKKMT